MPDASPRPSTASPWAKPVAWLAAGTLAAGLTLQSVLQNPDTASVFLSRATWDRWLGATVDPQLQLASVSLVGCLFVVALMAGALAAANRRDPLPPCRAFGLAGLGAFAWLVLEIVASIVSGGATAADGWTVGLVVFSTGISSTVAAAFLAVWVAALLHGLLPNEWSPRTAAVAVGVAAAAYLVAYLALNVGLYGNMRVPHGDSAMYEEHLWNVLHGKGFRSYLDQGLFLGEHIQVVHLLLLPLYAIWSSPLLLEAAESLAIAACGPLVYRLARRHGASPQTAAWLGVTTLLYTPLTYLDISIDQKTFRPITFGVPLLLWTIDAIERRRWRETAAAVVLTLSCKEDYALVLAPLGAWIAAFPSLGLPDEANTSDRKTQTRRAGLIVAAASLAYLVLAVLVVIPAFRGGEQTHYAADYYPKLGGSTGEIVVTCLTQPWVPLGIILAAPGLIYLAHTLAPLGGSPLLSPSRLAVALPALGITILNKFTEQMPQPVHHFHAPVLPVLFWAMAAAQPFAAVVGKTSSRWRLPDRWTPRPVTLARFVAAMALATGLFDGYGPLSIRFYDPGQKLFAPNLYVPDDRAAAWDAVDALIPLDARVASTDHIRPRLTHRERNYDYGQVFRRAVADYEDRVPDDADWIVLDRRGPYSSIGSLDEIRELQREPERWEVVADGAFIVLRRRE